MVSIKALEDITTDEAFWLEQRAEMTGVSLLVFKELYMEAAQALAEAQAYPFDFEAINTAADRFIATYTDAWWRGLEATTREGLRTAIATARTEGLGVEYVLKQVEPLFGAQRAERIAVSETTELIGAGAQESMRQAGVDGWDWSTVNDPATVCDTCLDMADGSPYPMSQPFHRAHVSCRCAPSPRMLKG